MDKLDVSRKDPIKLFAKKIAKRKPTNPIIIFSFGDLEKPVGIEPFILWALTEDKAKILAN